MLDFEGAMDWLERESKKGNSLVINLTKPGEDCTDSNESSTRSKCKSDDSDYKDNNNHAKPRHNKGANDTKQNTADKRDSPENQNANMCILFEVCGGMLGDESSYKRDKIDADEGDKNGPLSLYYVICYCGPTGNGNREELRGEGGQDDILQDDG